MGPAGHMAQTGEKGNAYRVLIGKPGGKRRLEGPSYNFETGLKEIGWKQYTWKNTLQHFEASKFQHDEAILF